MICRLPIECLYSLNTIYSLRLKNEICGIKLAGTTVIKLPHTKIAMWFKEKNCSKCMRQVAYLIFAPPAYFSGEHDLVLCHEQGLAGLLDPAGLESLQRLVKLV